MTADELLDQARNAPQHSPERSLWLVAAVERIIGKPIVLLGGSAVNTYTGEYVPTDIDLIGWGIGPAERTRLTEYGFTDPGAGHRHLHITLGPDESPVFIEFPTPPLDAEEVNQVELTDDVVVSIISLTDLVVDRLKQATDGSAVTQDAAIALIAATYTEIDWEAVDQQVAAQDDDVLQVADRTAKIRRAVVKALRNKV